MKNYGKLLEKISRWLKQGGKLFVHIFTHRNFAYHFEKGLSEKKAILNIDLSSLLDRMDGEDILHRRNHAVLRPPS